jgi:hypothetical protein
MHSNDEGAMWVFIKKETSAGERALVHSDGSDRLGLWRLDFREIWSQWGCWFPVDRPLWLCLFMFVSPILDPVVGCTSGNFRCMRDGSAFSREKDVEYHHFDAD